MGFLIDRDDPEWAFGYVSDILPSDEEWHCLQYEMFRSIDILRDRYSEYWTKNSILPIPSDFEELKAYASQERNRVLIGDLDEASMLFLLPEFPATPWLKLSSSRRRSVISIVKSRTTVFDDSRADPLYIISAKTTDGCLDMTLLLDSRESVSRLKKSFRAKRKKLCGQSRAHAFNDLEGLLPWIVTTMNVDANEKIEIVERKFENHVRTLFASEQISPRMQIGALLRRLAAYRIRERLGVGYSYEQLLECGPSIYSDASQWSENVNRMARELELKKQFVTGEWYNSGNYPSGNALINIVGRMIDV